MILILLLAFRKLDIPDNTAPTASYFGAKSITPFLGKPESYYGEGMANQPLDPERYFHILSQDGEVYLEGKNGQGLGVLYGVHKPNSRAFVGFFKTLLDANGSYVKMGPVLGGKIQLPYRPTQLTVFADGGTKNDPTKYPFWIWIANPHQNLNYAFHYISYAEWIRKYQGNHMKLQVFPFTLAAPNLVFAVLNGHTFVRELDLPIQAEGGGFGADEGFTGIFSYPRNGETPYRFYSLNDDRLSKNKVPVIGSYLPHRIGYPRQIIEANSQVLKEYVFQYGAKEFRFGITTVNWKTGKVHYRWLGKVPNRLDGWHFEAGQVFPRIVLLGKDLYLGTWRHLVKRQYSRKPVRDYQTLRLTNGRLYVVKTTPLERYDLGDAYFSEVTTSHGIVSEPKLLRALKGDWSPVAQSIGGKWKLVARGSQNGKGYDMYELKY